MSGGKKIMFVCAQAAARLPELCRDDRAQLLAGLKLMLPIAEFEQCQLIENSIAEHEAAQRRVEETQLILKDMLTADAPNKSCRSRS